MDRQFRYREKHVHDLAVEDLLVRLWDAEGAINGEMIRSAFRPLAATGFVWPYVALMPDYHPGEGSMIGSVIPTREIVLPSVIGGDLGCGMTAVRLPLVTEQVTSRLPQIERTFRASIPVGTAHNSQVTERVQNNSIWRRDVRGADPRQPIAPQDTSAVCLPRRGKPFPGAPAGPGAARLGHAPFGIEVSGCHDPRLLRGARPD